MTRETKSPLISIEGICKSYESRTVLNGASLLLSEGEVVALTGPSGAGKTTLLRIIAGLDFPDAGTVRVGRDLATEGCRLLLAPHQRDIGMVFQEPALWPHMTVQEHVIFGLAAMSRAEARTRAKDVMEMTEISALAHARPSELSGGEKARVSLARALAPHPSVLLLDEPLANLHQSLRKDLAVTIHSIAQDTGAAVLIVTHSPADLANLNVRTIHLNGGNLGQ